jgi:hypothetical protein
MFIGVLLITTLSFSCRLPRASDRPCLLVNGRPRDRPRYTLPSSRPWKYIAGVKNCYAELLMGMGMGHGAWGMGHGAWGIGELVVNNQ